MPTVETPHHSACAPAQDLRDDRVRGVGVPAVPRPDPIGQHLHDDEECRSQQGEERGNEMGQDAGAERDRRPAPVPAGPQPTGHEAEKDQRQGDAERVGVLPRQGGEEVPPVNGVRVVEQVAQGQGGQRTGNGAPHAEEAPHGPGRHRQQHRAEHGDPFEGQRVGDDVAGQRGEQVRQDEVEGVEGEAVVPPGVPAGELAVRQETRSQERRHGVVPPVVASGRVGRGQQQAGMELPQHHPDDRGDAHGPSPPWVPRERKATAATIRGRRWLTGAGAASAVSGPSRVLVRGSHRPAAGGSPGRRRD